MDAEVYVWSARQRALGEAVRAEGEALPEEPKVAHNTVFAAESELVLVHAVEKHIQ